MNFTNQKPFIATREQVLARWGLSGKGFRCNFCGHKFKEGDTVRWVSMAGYGPYLNFMTCQACDGPGVRDKWIAHTIDGNKRFWWMQS